MKCHDYKTIKGYINALKRLDKICISTLKGFDKLSEEEQEELKLLSGDISNTLGVLKNE